MAAVTICSDFGTRKNKVCHCFHCFPSICQEVMGPDAMILVFWMLSFKPTFSLSSFTFIKKLFSSSSLSAIRVVWSPYLRLLIFLPPVLIPACTSSSLAFRMMCSACKLNKQGYSIELGGSMVELMVTSPKRAYTMGCVTQVGAPRALPPCGRPLLTHTSARDWNTGLAQSLWGPLVLVHTWFFWALLASLTILPLIPSFWEFSFSLGHGVSFFGGIQYSPVDGCYHHVVILEFLQEKMSAHSSTLPSLWFLQKILFSFQPTALSLRHTA